MKIIVHVFEQTTRYLYVLPNPTKMAPKILSLFALFTLATMTVSMASASSPTQIALSSYGNTKIDLAWDEKDQMIRTWTEFSNFDPKDGSFAMQIIQKGTGKVVSESSISVMTTSQSSSIDFNSFVLYMVNALDICQNEEFDPSTMPWQECDPLTGEYEMQISTNDGSVVESTPFTIVDTRV
jgi:hypothetical protein